MGLLALNSQELIRPLDEWTGLQVRFSTMYVPPPTDGDLAETHSGQTMAGSMNISGADLHPVRVFARLIYRILNGSEVAAAVAVGPAAYIPAVTPGRSSNSLLRDVICRQKTLRNASSILKELCTDEGVVFRLPAGSSLARTSSFDAGPGFACGYGRSTQAPALGSCGSGKESRIRHLGPGSSDDGNSDLAETVTAVDDLPHPREKLPPREREARARA